MGQQIDLNTQHIFWRILIRGQTTNSLYKQ